jgi:hypothetical protein
MLRRNIALFADRPEPVDGTTCVKQTIETTSYFLHDDNSRLLPRLQGRQCAYVDKAVSRRVRCEIHGIHRAAFFT